MTPAEAERTELPVLPRMAHTAMSLLYQHRLISTPQLQQMMDQPKHQYLTLLLQRCRTHGLAERVRAGWSQPNYWFLTDTGAQAVESGLDATLTRPYRMDASKASGPLQRHTSAVVATGLAFVATARERGDQCTPYDWVPEVSHPIRDGGERLIADALLHYILVDAATAHRSHAQAFIELDRCTMPIPRLAAKLTAYARYYDYVPAGARPPATVSAARSLTPAWQQVYPRFPRVLLVVDGEHAEADRRIEDLAFYLQGLTYLHRARPGFAIGATALAQLRRQGPLARIWQRLAPAPAARTDFLLTPR